MGNCLCQILSKKVFTCSVPYDLNYANNLTNIYVIHAYTHMYVSCMYVCIYAKMQLDCLRMVELWETFLFLLLFITFFNSLIEKRSGRRLCLKKLKNSLPRFLVPILEEIFFFFLKKRDLENYTIYVDTWDKVLI